MTVSPPLMQSSSPSGEPELSIVFESLTRRKLRDIWVEWEDLADQAAEPNIFQSPQFIEHSLPLLRRQNPQILMVKHDGLLIGLIILQRDRGYARIPVSFWKNASHPEQYLGTPLVRAGFEDQFAVGLTSWLDQAPLGCGFVQLTQIASQGPIALALFNHARALARDTIIANKYTRAAIIPRPQSAQPWDGHLNSSRRKALRRARRRLDAQGTVSIERLYEQDDLEAWTEHFLALEDTGWKGDAGSSILSCPHETILYRDMMRGLLVSNNLNLSRLCIDGEPIAYTLDVLAPPTGFCLKSAIHPDFRKFSPGVLMELETLKFYHAREGLDLLDSCTHQDNALLNELWPDRREIFDLSIARRGPLYEATFAAMRAVKALVQKVTDG